MVELELVNVGLLLVGLLLAFVGAALSVYAVTLTGFMVGAGAGYVIAPNIVGLVAAEGMVVSAGAVVVFGLLGAFVAYAGLSFAVLGIGAVVGAFVGRFAVGPFYGEELLVLTGATLAGLAVGAIVGFVLTRTTLVFSTAFIGAAFGTGSLTLADFKLAQETLSIDPLIFEMTAPLFLAVFGLGVLSQVGLFKFGYVTRLVGVLPGARRWTASNDKARTS